MTKTVLILGPSGKIGTHAAAAFGNAGWTVRPYDRKTDMTAAAMGVDVIVNGLNPPAYHNWATLIPAITAQVIAAAQASGATVILPGNVYNYAAVPGVWDETTPHHPPSRKGRIRVAAEQAYAASGVQTIVLRAGSFIDPNPNGDVMDAMLLRDIAKGKITLAHRPDTRHAFAYLPDWARAAVALAEMRGELARFEDVPMPGPAFSMAEFKPVLEQALNRPLQFAAFPWWIMSLLSPFWELARELREMRYLWETSHALGGAKFALLLPDFVPTDLRSIMLAGLPGDIYPNKAMGSGSQTVVAQ